MINMQSATKSFTDVEKWFGPLIEKACTVLLLLLLLSCFSRVRLCATPKTAAHQAPLSLGFSRQGHWSGLPFPSPMHESEKWKWSCSFVPDSKSLQLCLMLCDLMDCSLHGSSVHGILQARMLEWIQCPPLGHLSNSGIEPTSLMSPAWQAGSLPLAQPGKLQKRAAKCTKCQIFYVCHFIYFSKVHYKVVAVTLIF